MTTPLEIRTELEAILADYLGVYTFSNTATTPAIQIDEGKQELAPSSVSGLECVIVPSLEVPLTPLMGGYQQTVSTLVLLKQWDISQNTLSAMDAVVSGLSFATINITNIVRQMRSSQLDNIEVCRITLQESSLIETD